MIIRICFFRLRKQFFIKNKEERYSRVPRLSDTQLMGPKKNGDSKQQSEIEMRHLPLISTYGYVGGR